jgi:transposase
MAYGESSHQGLDTPTKNCIVGYALAMGNTAAARHNENVNPHTVQHVIKKFLSTSSTANKPHPGHPRKLNDYDKCQIIRVSHKQHWTPLGQITNQIAANVSTSSVQRALAENGYHCRVACHVPYLSPRHKRARLNWAQINRVI